MDEPDRRGASGEDAASLPAATNRERERAVERLRAHYVRDDIDVEDYERLVDRAWAAGSRTELDELFTRLPALADADLPPATTGTDARHAPPVASPGEQREHGFQIAIMGGSERKGSWVPARKLHSFALMGGIGLDFREARLGPGVTEVTILAVMGGAEVIVPPGVNVESDGFGIMGGFEGHSQRVDTDDPSAPVLKIRGLALMGGIEVQMMLPGETGRDARIRRKQERKRLKEGRRGG